MERRVEVTTEVNGAPVMETITFDDPLVKGNYKITVEGGKSFLTVFYGTSTWKFPYERLVKFYITL